MIPQTPAKAMLSTVGGWKANHTPAMGVHAAADSRLAPAVPWSPERRWPSERLIRMYDAQASAASNPRPMPTMSL